MASFYALVPSIEAANIIYYPVSSTAVAIGWLGVLRSRFAGRWIAALLLLGSTIWLLSDWLWWLIDVLESSVPFPSPLDVLYLSGYPIGLLALVFLWRQHMRDAFGGLLESAIFATSMGILIWSVAIVPSGTRNDLNWFSITALAYPILDALLLVGLVQLLFVPALRRVPSLYGFAAGIAAFLVSDALYSFDALRDNYVDGTWRDYGWLFAYVAFGFAAAHPSLRALGSSHPYGPRHWALRAPALALFSISIPVAALIAAQRGVTNATPVIVAAACFIIVAFALRLGLIMRDQSRYEEQLADTVEKLGTLIEAAPLGIVAVDRSRVVTLWNPGAEKIFGWKAAEVMGEVNPLFASDEASQNIERMFRGEHGHSESLRPRKDGTEVEVLVSSAPLLSRSGEVAGAVALFVDLSERKALEESLRHSQRLETVGQLAGGVAHDFNNLLTAILGYCSLSLERAKGDLELTQNLSEIARASERASELTHQLLAFGRRQVLQPRAFDLNTAVTEIDAILRRVLGENIRITHVLAPSGCPVKADQGQIEQVLMNLGVNARDAMPAGGTLSFVTENVELSAAEAEPLGIEPGPYARLYVADSGLGMDEETRRHVFEPFFTTKEVGKGSGLGLATVYGIVSQSDGHVAVESEPGKGATFVVHLPAADLENMPVPRVAAESRRRTPAEAHECVLLVEDERSVRDITVQMLEREGYGVVSAADSREAFEHIANGPVDLLITDLMLPGMDGQTMASKLRSSHPDLPVIFVSGYSREEHYFGPEVHFLQKPYSSADLCLAVRRALDRDLPVTDAAKSR